MMNMRKARPGATTPTAQEIRRGIVAAGDVAESGAQGLALAFRVSLTEVGSRKVSSRLVDCSDFRQSITLNEAAVVLESSLHEFRGKRFRTKGERPRYVDQRGSLEVGCRIH